MIRALLRMFRKPTDFSALEPIQPRVKPDPEAVEALERRRAELDYQPSNGFLVERLGADGSGVHGLGIVWHGKARPGAARQGSERHAVVWQGEVI